MLADQFIEKNAIILRNLNTNGNNTTKDVWASGTGYGFYGIPYETPLILGHYYYLKCTYKFTTINQSPTWFNMYFQGGGNGGPNKSNPVAETEYTVSNIQQPIVDNSAHPVTSGTMYNGNSNAISGVTSYVKNVIVYDVTNLYYCLLGKGTVTSISTFKTWCDSNLEWKPRYTNYDVSSLISDTSTKVYIKGGIIVANKFIEPDGMQYYSMSTGIRNNTWFDSGSGIAVYNNQGNGTVTHTRIDASSQNSPFYPEHKYILQITTNGTASPYAGGFYTGHMAAANKVFVEKFVAKIPVGYNVTCHYNSQGTGASVAFISPTAGTGDWAEYTVLYKCGSSGTFSSGGHIAVNGTSNTSVTWYVAYVNDCDITSDTNLQYYSVLRKTNVFKNGYHSGFYLNETNLLPNGDGSDTNTAMLPSGWSYDTSDVAGNAKASIVQPVGASAGFFGTNLRINPCGRYKISYWVKCKGDMTSFLTALYIMTEDGTTYTCTNTCFVPGTKTTLASALNTGATSMTLTDASNWVVTSYSKIGFRSGSTWSMKTYNNLGTSNAPSGTTGMVASVSGNTVTFNVAYTGSNMAAGTVVVESYDGGTFPYPIQKGNLPTDNTWKYVEGYFGVNNSVWEGSSSSGWTDIPGEARKMSLRLNLYSNTGTVPIKYSDIKIEEVGSNCGHRFESKIQLKKES